MALLLLQHLASFSIAEGVYPATFIIDRDGRIVVRHLGTARWDDPSVAKFLRGLNDLK
jgi:peroxiredoxin